jgi:hypothetical protein
LTDAGLKPPPLPDAWVDRGAVDDCGGGALDHGGGGGGAPGGWVAGGSDHRGVGAAACCDAGGGGDHCCGGGEVGRGAEDSDPAGGSGGTDVIRVSSVAMLGGHRGQATDTDHSEINPP